MSDAPRRATRAVGAAARSTSPRRGRWRRRAAGLAAVPVALAVASLVAVALVLAAALDAAPVVAGATDVAADDVARVAELVRSHDPRRAAAGRARVAVLRERDVEVAAGLLARRWLPAGARVRIGAGTARAAAALRAPPGPWTAVFGEWLNVEIDWVETAALPQVDRVRVGRLPLPPALAERALAIAARRAGLDDEVAVARGVVDGVRFVPGQAELQYTWREGSVARLFAGVVGARDLARLRAYHDRLVDLAAAPGSTWWPAPLPLPRLLASMFALANERSAAGGDAARENRAALTVLALYTVRRGVHTVAPAARGWPRPRALPVRLGGRDDFAQHFVVSAALAAEGGGALSQAFGVVKEIDDTRGGGSGFSFTDIAVDRAGTRFGRLAVLQPDALQQRVAAGVDDAELLPRVDDLPEFLTDASLQRRYGGVGGDGYERLLAEIDRRVEALPLAAAPTGRP